VGGVTPRISVLVTAYNYGRYLGRALDSVLAQDYQTDALEVIVVDDGSTDDTPEVVRPYLDRIRYVRKENGGVVSAFNRAVEEATGDYYAILCADDMWVPGRLRRLVDFLEERPEVGLVYGDLTLVDEQDRVVAESYFASYGVQPQRGRVLGALMESCFVPGPAILVRASLRSAFYPLPEWAPFEDWWVATEVARVSAIDFVAEPVALYRQHGANQVLDAGEEQLARQLAKEARFRGYLLSRSFPGGLTVEELVAAYRKHAWAVSWAAERLGRAARELAPPTDSSSERAAAIAFAARGETEAAVFGLVRALGLDLFDPEARIRLDALLPLLAREREAAAALLADAGIRAVATVAFADELASAPDLLASYAATHGPEDDATLVILGEPDEALLAAVTAAGLDADDAADLVVVPSAAAPALATRAAAVLSRRPLAGPLGALPRAA
jgi:glycosyltransferase involved in cell wall biosynthesis